MSFRDKASMRASADKAKAGRDINIYNILAQAPQVLATHMRVRDFMALVEERTRDFVGRRYIFDEIDRAIADPAFPCGYIVIKGEPGIGKTALVARLVKERGYVHHFNTSVQNIRSTRDFLANLCAQLIVRYGLKHDALPPKAMDDSGFLLELLAEAAEERKDVPVVVVVDAIDEAEDSSLSAGANRLSLPQVLPGGVFFVLTMREKHDERLFVDKRKDIPLKDTDPRNQDDVRSYVLKFVSDHRSKMMPKIEQWGGHEGRFIEVLAEKSEGNFQYLYFVLPDIRDGRLNAGNIDKIENLPQGLHGYYQRHWRTMKAKDMGHYKRLQRPVLCFLATAREPISVAMLVEWTELTPEEILDVIKNWREFLNERQSDKGKRLYHIYHASFGEFLDEEEGLSEFHGKIADVALAKVEAARRRMEK